VSRGRSRPLSAVRVFGVAFTLVVLLLRVA
jgi:hypothetical protein